MLVEHELLEGFRYNDIRIFNPHHTVHELSLPARINQGRQTNEAAETSFRNSVPPVEAK
jgi:hypothetical protein